MAEALKAGDRIPPFFLKDHQGYDVSDDDLIGSPLVIVFFLENEPSGKELVRTLQDNLEKFDALQALIIGVGSESVDEQNKFVAENQLQFSLLSDENKDMARVFGVLDKNGEVVQSTFLINSKGVVKWMEKPVEVKGHIDRVVKALDEHCKNEVVRFDDYKGEYDDFLKESLDLGEGKKKIKKQIMKEFGIKKKDLDKK